MSLVVNPEPETLGRIRAYAEATGIGVEEAATHFLNMAFGGTVDPADLEALREGIADADAGRTVSLEEYAATVEARYGWARQGKKGGETGA